MDEDALIEIIWKEINDSASWSARGYLGGDDTCEVDGRVDMRSLAKKFIEYWKEQCR